MGNFMDNFKKRLKHKTLKISTLNFELGLVPVPSCLL